MKSVRIRGFSGSIEGKCRPEKLQTWTLFTLYTSSISGTVLVVLPLS